MVPELISVDDLAAGWVFSLLIRFGVIEKLPKLPREEIRERHAAILAKSVVIASGRELQYANME
ncbi:hypothetical protein GCM10008018_02510 [Paenibacillus marchantiophytorum]|uniref:Uncharacterized protein n=1 Tax=Paenibacillus marchantiophytorum TaxID=1619310 RepID=A0ABQ2BN90_9BACL|nr:hypothetical protein GCM10008018_02510 [Paenibacillus marchantiophytorum]